MALWAIKSEVKFSIFKIYLILIILCSIIFFEYSMLYEVSMYVDFLLGPLYILIGCLFVISIINDLIRYLKTKMINHFIPTILGIILITCIIGIRYYQYDRFLKPSIIEARIAEADYDGNDLAYYLKLDDDNSFILQERINSKLKFHCGTYYLNMVDSIIDLKEEIGLINISRKLKIIRDTSNNETEFVIYQLGLENQVLTTRPNFKIENFKQNAHNRR